MSWLHIRLDRDFLGEGLPQDYLRSYLGLPKSYS